jgi:translation initiation factor IF-1
MSKFKQGDKVKFFNTYTRYHVVIAKKGSNGIVVESEVVGHEYKNGIPIEMRKVKVQLTSGDVIEVPEDDYIELWKQIKKPKLEELSPKELLDKLAILHADEIHTSMRTKKYQKVVKDVGKVEAEILRRMERGAE